MSIEENKSLVRSYLTEMFACDENQVSDVLNKHISPDFQAHGPWKNREGLEKTFTDFLKSTEKMEATIEDLIAEGNKVVVRHTIQMTISGSEKTISIIGIYRIDNNQIVEVWTHGESFF